MQDVPNLPSAFYCGYFDCTIFGELSVSPKRTRRMYEIEYYLENGKNTFSDDCAYRIKKHYVLIGRPGEICNSELPFRTKFLKLEIEGSIARQLDRLPSYFPAVHTYEIEKHFDALIAMRAQGDTDPLLIYSHLLSLLSILIADGSIKEKEKSDVAIAVEKAKSYIQEHSAEPIKLSDVASAANLSPSYFHSLFTESCGMTPHAYLIACRIASARELLCATSLSIEEIAQRCGFGTQQYLTNVFKQYIGLSPGKCRKKDRESYLH